MTDPVQSGLSRRQALLAAGGALAVAAVPPSVGLAGSRGRQATVTVADRDIECRVPPHTWSDISAISPVALQATDGRVVVDASDYLEVGGDPGTICEIGLAQDGGDVEEGSQSFVRVDQGSHHGRVVKLHLVTEHLNGAHQWRVKIRHTNTEVGPLAQAVFLRTRRQPLVLSATVL